jgi:hypothetical protein
MIKVKTKKELINIIDTYTISNSLCSFELDEIAFELKHLTGVDYEIGGRDEYITVNECYFSDFIKSCKAAADSDLIFFTDPIKAIIERLYKKASFFNNGLCYWDISEKNYINIFRWYKYGVDEICDYLLSDARARLDSCYNDDYIIDYYINNCDHDINIDNSGRAYTVIKGARAV